MDQKLENIKPIDGLLNQLEILVRKRKIIISIFLVITLLQLIRLLFMAPIFIATTTILPSQLSSKSRTLSAIGLSPLSGLLSSSVDDWTTLYGSILTSRKLINRVLAQKFYDCEDSTFRSLLDLFKIPGESLNEREVIGYNFMIKSVIEIIPDRVTKITTIKIESTDPELAAKIASAMVEELDKYLQQVNTAKASRNKLFIEERVAETKDLLVEAEEKLKFFRQTNKRIEKSPELQLEQGRIARELRVQEEVFLTLKKELEVNKIEEVKSLPLINVLDEPFVPISKSKPKRRRLMILTALASLILGIIVALTMEKANDLNQDPGRSSQIKKIINLLREDYLILKMKISKTIQKK